MPIQLIDPNGKRIEFIGLPSKDFTYKYPDGLDFSPDSELHKTVLTKILQYAQEAANAIAPRHKEWAEIDTTLTAYVPADTKKAARDRGDKTPPIIVPSSYAIIETLLAYMTATFLQDPVFRYEPTGPEDASGSALLEIIIQTQVIKAKMGLNLITQWRDGFAYGLGVTTPSWTVTHGHRRVNVEKENTETGIKERGIKREDVVLYEGNALNNVDAFLYLPDPSVAVQDVQKGRYVGWVSKDNKISLLDEEINGDSELFNIKYLQFINGQSVFMTTHRDRADTASGRTYATAYRTDMDSPVDLVSMYAKLIPSDWGLGSSDSPEKWRFIVAGDNVIISAKRLNLDHDMYPVSVTSPDYDGYSATPISRIEMSLGMQVVMNFLFNSHISNVRKAVNDTLIVDPSMIYMKDLRSPEPGKIVRTRRSMWGKGVKGAVEQLKISDITRGNLDDMAMILSQMKEATAAVDVISGNVRTTGERRSATESRDARTGALAKLSKTARVISMQSMQDLGFMFASQTQQLMSEDMKIRLMGRWAEDLIKEYGGDSTKIVSPNEILVDTDVVVSSGNVPGSEPTDLWIQLLQVAVTNQETLQQLDVPRIFMHIARQLGATNALDFMKSSVSIQSDETVQQQVQNGNIIPVEQFSGVE